ncbi:anthranilate synthase component I family protein, partial [Candidatus Peregrinibacteria bacterium]|nr:anthranilate synthase component I family protein [Candidatus Peregrinibacteria bacterium]
MTKFKKINQDLIEGRTEIPYVQATPVFSKFYKNYKHKFLFESADISPIYGRLSLIGVDPSIKFTGKDTKSKIQTLNNRGNNFQLRSRKISRERKSTPESFLKEFRIKQKTFLGLYGAFSYDFIRTFEDIGQKLPKNNTNDFTLFLYDTFIHFDHLKEKCEIIVYRKTKKEIQETTSKLKKEIAKSPQPTPKYKIQEPNFSLTKKEYEDLVRKAKTYTKKGELYEVVFSNILKAKFAGDPFALYMKYREINPSPYMFHFDFGNEQLVGASPEMMVRCEDNKVHLRPISGTAKRSQDPIEDHDNMLKLLQDPKEKAELDMLVDLGRNDLSRVCEPGIEISDYRFIEKYSKVMHTITHLTGTLRKDCTALDALISCINAGTLTGTPKIAAMQAIETHEKERRGYYGGTIGYLTLNGDMDTGIIIRTAHIKNGNLRFQVGATLLNDSTPSKEYQETLYKAQAF